MDSISQHSLHDELLDRLRRMIIGGQFLPGDKIPERQLCEQFGVSRTPLREALKVLAAEGFIRLAPNRGAVVAELSFDEIEECVPISAAIEALSGELACEHITNAEIEEIKAELGKMMACFEAGDMGGFLQSNHEIHEKIVAATRNATLSTIYGTLFFRVGWPRLMSGLSHDEIAKVIEDHKEMVRVLESRQSQDLSKLLKTHWENVFATYRKAAGNDLDSTL